MNITETCLSQKQDAHSTLEDVRSRFYEGYRKVSEEYDKDFNKRYDEDLNTTLIFVSVLVASFLMVCTDTITGWSVLCSSWCLYHRGQLRAPARPK